MLAETTKRRQPRREAQVHEDPGHEQRLGHRDREGERRVPDAEVLEGGPDGQRGQEHQRREDGEVRPDPGPVRVESGRRALGRGVGGAVRSPLGFVAHSVCLPSR